MGIGNGPAPQPETIMKYAFNSVDNTLNWTADEGGDSATLHLDKCNSAIVGVAVEGKYPAASVHGMKQRCVDSAAIERKDAAGKVLNVTDEMRLAAVRKMVTHYESGTADWRLSGGAPRKSSEEMLAELLAADPEKLAAIIAAAQAKIANATG